MNIYKKAIVIKRADSDIFEEVTFVLKDVTGIFHNTRRDIIKEATGIVEEYEKKIKKEGIKQQNIRRQKYRSSQNLDKILNVSLIISLFLFIALLAKIF